MKWSSTCLKNTNRKGFQIYMFQASEIPKNYLYKVSLYSCAHKWACLLSIIEKCLKLWIEFNKNAHVSFLVWSAVLMWNWKESPAWFHQFLWHLQNCNIEKYMNLWLQLNQIFMLMAVDGRSQLKLAIFCTQ